MSNFTKKYYQYRKRLTRKSWGKEYFTSLEKYATGKRWEKITKPGFFDKVNGDYAYLAHDKRARKKLYTDFRIKQIMFGFSCDEYFTRECFKKGLIQCSHIGSDFRSRWLNKMLNRGSLTYYLMDKAVFANHWSDFFLRKWCDDNSSFYAFADTFSGIEKIIAKPKNGMMGRDIRLFELNSNNIGKIFEKLKEYYPEGYIAEEYYTQTGFMHELNPSSVNTIRVITVRDSKSGKVWPVSTFARVGVPGAIIDNFSAGGVTYNVDTLTGRICDGMSKASTGKPLKYHPGTQKSYNGLVIPRWQEVIDFCCRAHQIAPEGLDFIGWDVGLSEDKMILIEGNSRPGFGRNTDRRDNQWKRVLPALKGKSAAVGSK